MPHDEFIAYLSRHSISKHKWRAYEQIKIVVAPIAQDFREYEKMMQWPLIG